MMKDQAHAEAMIRQDSFIPVAGPADHPMIDLPFSVQIDGRQCRGRGISLIRAAISGLIDPQLDGAQRIGWFVFAFQGFTVALTIKVRVHSIDARNGHATLEFLEPMGDHLPQLRHLINAHIAGDMVTMGDALAVRVGPDAAAKPKVPDMGGFTQRLRQITGSTALVALSLALVTLVGTKVFQRVFTVALPAPATVMIEGQTLAATATGQIDYLNPEAKAGEVAFTIRANTGQTLSVAMPCDCVVQEQGLVVGSTVFAGDPVLHLSKADAPILLSGQVPVDRAIDMAGAERLDLRFADGTHVSARLLPSGITASGRSDELLAYQLVPETALPPTRVGQMAKVTIHRPVPVLLSPLAGLAGMFSNASEAIVP
ncbi:MAG: hypothetical protein HC844_06555 [Tabrizicola sp.]|nr:hypothetical protein [Tabrizicola sp.]